MDASLIAAACTPVVIPYLRDWTLVPMPAGIDPTDAARKAIRHARHAAPLKANQARKVFTCSLH